MTTYIALEEFRLTLELQGTTHADRDAALALRAASDGLDEVCGRSFQLTDDSNDEVRLFTPHRSSGCEVDDICGASEVLVSGSAWDWGTDFTGWPLNAALKSRPYTEFRALNGRAFPTGVVASVQVTGRFGWPQVPSQIQQATQILAAKLMLRARQAPFGFAPGGGLDAGGAARIARNDPDVMFLIGPFMKATLLA